MKIMERTCGTECTGYRIDVQSNLIKKELLGTGKLNRFRGVSLKWD